MNAGLTQVLDDGENTYLYGLGRIAQVNTETEYFMGDALGSVRQLVEGRDIVLAKSYAPYGEDLYSTGSGESAFAFTGEQTDPNGLVYLRARYYGPSDGRFLSRDLWAGDIDRSLTMNRWAYANMNPVNLTDPSGYAAYEFQVHPEDAKNPSQRDDVLEEWKKDHWNYGMPSNLLGREVDFIEWMQDSGRLTDNRAGNWYDIVDQYDVASRFASQRLLDRLMSTCSDPVIFLGLEPGVLEFAVFIAGIDQLDDELAEKYPLLRPMISYHANSTFWKAHNAALREGVRRADAAGLRGIEPTAEQAFINIMLYNVLEPGDQCANGEMAFCDFMISPFLNIGSRKIYPQEYPAKWKDVDFLISSFNNLGIWGAWVALGARPPSDIHMVKPIVETK